MKIYPIIAFFSAILLFSCKSTPNSDAPQFQKTGNPAIDSLTERIFKNPTDANLYARRAQLFYENGAQGGYDFAIKDMQYALVLDSTNVGFHRFLADVYMDYKQSRLAVATMERAAALAPTDKSTLRKLAELYLITKQYGMAFGTTDRVLKLDPQDAEAYFLLGMIAKERGEEPSAINAFQKAADLNADNKDAFIELGLLFTKRKNPLALRYFDNALLLDSLDANALMGKAFYLQNEGKIADAIAIYRNVVLHDSHSQAALFNLGVLYLDQNDLDKAFEHFDLIIRQSPTFYKAYYYRGFIAEKRGNPAAALADYRQSLEFKSDYDKALEGVKRLDKK